MSPQSTAEKPQSKPEKPRPHSPLYPHLSGKWAKTIKGKTFYFRTWDDPEGALQEYLERRDDLYAGLTPKGRADTLTIKDLCDEFLRHCRATARQSRSRQKAWA